MIAVPAFAQSGSYKDASNPGFHLVPDCPTVSRGNASVKECGWDQILELVRNLMAFMLFFSAAFATLAFAYAGFLYLTAFGQAGEIEKAHGIFTKVLIGFIFVFLGWLIIATILKTLGVNDAFSLVNFGSVSTFSN